MREMGVKQTLNGIYSSLYSHFGPQHWWPSVDMVSGKSSKRKGGPLEIAVGAILTQNTSWKNVEKAIANIKTAGLMSAKKLYSLTHDELASLIKPSGYYNIKAKRLRAFLKLVCEGYGGSLRRLFKLETKRMREVLLSVSGIGEETADSIILYAAGKPTFVIDAYTRRILSRHGLCPAKATYAYLKELFESNLSQDAAMFNEYHALLVRLGNTYCHARKPLCNGCPLEFMSNRNLSI